MEKNLPFVSVPLIDKGYNKFLIPFTGKLDDGNVFKTIITFLLQLIAIGILLGGVYLSLVNIFGNTGYIKQAITNESLSGGKVFGSVIGLILGFALSIATSWVLYSMIKKRTEQLNNEKFNGLIDFIFNKFIPKLIIIIGEVLFVLFLYIGILQILASFIGSYVFAPLVQFPILIIGLLPEAIPGFGIIKELSQGMIQNNIMGDYEQFGMFIKMGLMITASSFVILIVFYLYKEVYSYLFKLATNLIKFLPVFAFPLAIRHREETKKADLNTPKVNAKPQPSINMDEL